MRTSFMRTLYSTAQLQGNECVQVTRENLAQHMHTSREYTKFSVLQVRMHSLVFGLASGRF